VGAGCEAEHQHTRVGIAETGDRFPPIVATEIGASFFPRNLFPIFDQPGTASAGNNFAIQLNKPGRHTRFHCKAEGGALGCDPLDIGNSRIPPSNH
jgi:hypothetical protein